MDNIEKMIDEEPSWLKMGHSEMNEISWNIIDKMFEDNPYLLVNHQLTPYNDFFKKGIFKK